MQVYSLIFCKFNATCVILSPFYNTMQFSDECKIQALYLLTGIISCVIQCVSDLQNHVCAYTIINFTTKNNVVTI